MLLQLLLFYKNYSKIIVPNSEMSAIYSYSRIKTIVTMTGNKLEQVTVPVRSTTSTGPFYTVNVDVERSSIVYFPCPCLRHLFLLCFLCKQNIWKPLFFSWEWLPNILNFFLLHSSNKRCCLSATCANEIILTMLHIYFIFK